ncbi:hypothetical protein NP233_g1304 [Leucocoprinus birnbaumii]|uniref:Uncharacterized protein n=1 Tax=Leucocoprinus birnbaumii TaxID=56174 RepID=A0AAD5W195_9AGAR|nr:hypothetical protein NP233_g1304 [Leucocoprinus birnbaumii]
MKKQDENQQQDSPKLPSYLRLFHQHLAQLQDYCSGFIDENVNETTNINGVEWEASEKDSFFHALRLHSRLRPDLIAAFIGTKNEVEVSEFITCLEDALREEDLQEKKGFRAELPLAHEVSETWIEWEEESAESLTVNEEMWTSKLDDGTNSTVSLSESSAHVDDLGSNPPLGGIPYLTYGHLFVLDSLLKTHKNEASNNATSPSGEGDSSAQSLTQVGSDSPIRTLESGASSTLYGSRGSFQKSTSVASQQDLNPSGEDSLDIEGMSPRSRRRYQKRMHMRRKRAQATGSKVDETTDKLPPGFKKKTAPKLLKLDIPNVGETDQDIQSQKAAASVMSDVGPGNDADQISESENMEADAGPPFTTSTTRLPYQIARSDLQHRGVTDKTVVGEGLGIFNLKTLGKLQQLFISGYDPDLVGEDALISTELLILLLDILKDFLIQTMSRVIILEEEHRRLRGKTKVWRKNIDEDLKGTIDKSAIQFALKTMGIANEGTNQYFANLLGEPCDTPSHKHTGFGDNERLVASPNLFQRHPLHQDICPSHFNLVSLQGHSKFIGDDSDDLMDLDTDEEMLAEVLREEEVLDEEDTLANRSHEDSLWIQAPFPKKRAQSI